MRAEIFSDFFISFTEFRSILGNVFPEPAGIPPDGPERRTAGR